MEFFLHTIGYVTWSFIKCEKAQKAIENVRQATQRSEVTSKADNKSESHLIDNESLLYDTVDNCAEISFMEGSNMPNSNSIKTRKTFFKCKHKDSNKQAKKVLPRWIKKVKQDVIGLTTNKAPSHDL